MTASRDETEADAESKTDSEDDAETKSPFQRAYRRLVDAVNWFRKFNRGFSNNSHFLDRKD